ncbi:ArsC family transcriptional regulator [Barnesiella viscericola DSM 18177]|uniref:ArsC family transcriptional regulator n=1 Tax=Barnesiella viscericola DSM 18177 TaxID=880074 RepID=W0ES31_9BACT|nr:arsenate reductase family protein [Barnesiella viscericola]AHF11921.1 ArsC family transcriptional regulator [Barnesiella viscericola DSM 18177]
METLFFQYPPCSTCRKAAKWLADHHIEVTARHIVETPPSAQELSQWIARSGMPLQKFFNTSGQRYRELKLKELIPVSSPDELIALLASDGMLIKRPLLVTDTHVLAGFDPKRWEEALCPQSR